MISVHTRTLLFVTSFLGGIFIGEHSPHSSYLVIALCVYLLLQYIVDLYYGLRGRTIIPQILITISLGVCIGIVRMQLVVPGEAFVCESGCSFEGVVVREHRVRNNLQQIIVRPVDATDDTKNILLTTVLYPEYKKGDKLFVQGKVTIPETIFPHEGNQAFDYSAYLLTRGIGSVSFYPKLELVGEEKSFTSSLTNIRENFVTRISVLMDQPESSLATGMLFGNTNLSEEVLSEFRVAGISHIIVLSGFNIAILISFVLILFRILPLHARVACASLVTLLFIIMVEGEVSVIRATIMAGISLLALSLGREYVAKQALIISLFLIVMYDPLSLLYDVSLHLSFLATFGIVYGVPLLQAALSRVLSQSRNTYLSEVVNTSFAAYVTTLPYVMWTFGSLSPYALVANLIVVPLVPICMLVTTVSLLISYMSITLGLVVGLISSWLHACIIFVASGITQIPFANVSVSVSNKVMVGMYVALIGAFFIFQKKFLHTKSFTPSLDTGVSYETSTIRGDNRNKIITDIIPY